MNAKNLKSTQNWIVHHNQFGEVSCITCDDCDRQYQVIVDHRVVHGDERQHCIDEINSQLRADGVQEISESSDVIELIADPDGSQLLITSYCGEIMAVVVGENGAFVPLDESTIDDAIARWH